MLFWASSRNLFNCCQCSLCGVTTRLSCFWHNAPIFFRERTFFWEFPASEPVTYIGTFLFLVAPIPPKSIPFPFLEIPESPVSKKGKKIVFGANILPLEVISKFTGGIFRGKIFSGLHQKKIFWHHAVHAWPSINDLPTPRLTFYSRWNPRLREVGGWL